MWIVTKVKKDNYNLFFNEFKKKVSNISKIKKIINEPFTNYLFKLASKEKNKLKIILGDFNLTILVNNNIFYQKI